MDIMIWDEVQGNILNCGIYWTTKNKNPSPKEIAKILTLSKGNAVVCRINRNVMHFEDGKFKRSGASFWDPKDLPPFLGALYVPYVALAKNMGTFQTHELAELLFAEEMVLDDYVEGDGKYAKTKEKFSELWPDQSCKTKDSRGPVQRVRMALRALKDEGAFTCPNRNEWCLEKTLKGN